MRLDRLKDDSPVPQADVVQLVMKSWPTCPHGWEIAECDRCSWFPGDPRQLEAFEDDEYEDAISDEDVERLWVTIELQEQKPRTRSELDDYAEAELERRKRRRVVVSAALEDALRSHGTPLHWQVLQRMVEHRLRVVITPQETYLTLNRFQDRFRALGEGVYALRRKRAE